MKTIRIGKLSTNDYVVQDDTVSRNHAQMTITDSSEVFIKDLGSLNGTFVDGKKIQTETKLIAGNVVRLGNKVINWQEISKSNQNKTMVIDSYTSKGDNNATRYIIGRDENCSIRFTQSEVSSRHAMLEKNANGEPQISDLGSTNGTYVNGQRIFSATKLHKGDRVLLANKYPLMWESYFPIVESANNPQKRRFILSVIAACFAGLMLICGGLFWYQKNHVWAPEEVYETYKSSIVYIQTFVHYTPYYHGIKLSEMLSDDFEIYNVDGLSVIKQTQGWSGSGSVVSPDGLIVTNRHVASFPADEDMRNREKIKKQVKEDLAILYSQFSAYYSQAKRQQKKKIEEILDYIKTIYNTDEEIEIRLEYDFLGIAFNDTHISGIKDMYNCSFIRNHPDDNVDAALIQLNSKKVPDGVKIVDLMNISKPKHRKLGCKVYTIGFPRGELVGKQAIGLEANNQSGEITQEQGDITYGHNMVTTSGASGSPVFDSHGRFAGLIATVWAFGGTPTGYNGAVRPEKVAELLK